MLPPEWCYGCSRGSAGCRILDHMPFTPSTIAALVIAASFAAGLNVAAPVNVVVPRLKLALAVPVKLRVAPIELVPIDAASELVTFTVELPVILRPAV